MVDCQNNLMPDRFLKESNVIAALHGLLESPSMQELGTGISFMPEVAAAVRNVPEEDVVPKDYHERCMELVTQRNIAQMRKRFEAEKQLPKHGHWIEQEGYDGDVCFDCSVCGESWCLVEGTPADNDMRYCPHCGAKMDGGEDNAKV